MNRRKHDDIITSEYFTQQCYSSVISIISILYFLYSGHHESWYDMIGYLSIDSNMGEKFDCSVSLTQP